MSGAKATCKDYVDPLYRDKKPANSCAKQWKTYFERSKITGSRMALVRENGGKKCSVDPWRLPSHCEIEIAQRRRPPRSWEA